MLRIIINADDLGSTRACNNAVFRLMSLGKISSSTLMANAPHFDDAVQRAKQFPQCSFGVHLNISQFRPLTDVEIFKKNRMINEKEQFRFQKFIFPIPRLVRAIQNELYDQIAKVVDHGIKVSHFDSHHHVHTRLWMSPIINFLSKKFDIRKIRSKFSDYRCSQNGHLLKRLVRQLREFPHRFIQARLLGLKTPDHFANINDGIDFFSTHSVKHPLNVELMCHPGVRGFKNDLLVLLGDYECAIRSPHKLISYHEL